MSAIVAPSAPTLRTRTASDRTFFLSVAVAAALLIFIGFSRSYYLKTWFPLAPPLSLLLHVHGAVFTAWVLYFVLQTALIAVHRPALHRRLGILGAALGAAVIVLGLAVAFMAMRLNRGTPPFDPETQFLVALVDIVTFSIFFVAGWLQRGNRAAHQRLMLLSVVAGLLSAPLGRIVGYGVSHPVVAVVNLAFILAGPVYDVVTRRRIHPVYVYGCLFALVTLPPLRFPVGASPWWHRVAHTLAGLPTAAPAHTTAGMTGPRPTSPDDRSITRVRHARTWLVGVPDVVHLDPVAQRTTVRAPDFRAGPDVTAYHELPSVPGWRAGSPATRRTRGRTTRVRPTSWRPGSRARGSARPASAMLTEP